MKAVRGFACVALMTCAGCATILNDPTQTVNVRTSNNAKISGTVDGKPFTTPGTVAVERKKTALSVQTTEPGCAPTTNANSEVDPKFFINILSGGAFGSTTDYASSKMWRYADTIVISCGQ